MTEHEKLKNICDKIWYNYFTYYKWNFVWPVKETHWKTIVATIDVRKIIFTDGFKNSFFRSFEWIYWCDLPTPERVYNWLLYNLDNPVDYLYNNPLLWNSQ